MSGAPSSARARSGRGASGTGGADGDGGLAPEQAAVFTGELRRFRDVLRVPGEDAGAIPAADLLRPGILDDVLAPMLARHPDADERAVISMWSQWYFARLVIPATTLAVRAHRILPLNLDEVEVVFDDEGGLPATFGLPRPGPVRPDADAFERFRPLLRGHVEPLVEALSDHSGLARSLLWGNAGSYLDWTLSLLASEGDGEESPELPGSSLFGVRRWPDGWKNPLRGAMRVVESGGAGARQRRVCCLRHLIPETEGCGEACPLGKS